MSGFAWSDKSHQGGAVSRQFDRLSEAALLFFCLFMSSLPFAGVNLRFKPAGLTELWSYPHVFLGVAVIFATILFFRRRPKLTPISVAIAVFAVIAGFSGAMFSPDKTVAIIFSLGLIRGLCVFIV